MSRQVQPEIIKDAHQGQPLGREVTRSDRWLSPSARATSSARAFPCGSSGVMAFSSREAGQPVASAATKSLAEDSKTPAGCVRARQQIAGPSPRRVGVTMQIRRANMVPCGTRVDACEALDNLRLVEIVPATSDQAVLRVELFDRHSQAAREGAGLRRGGGRRRRISGDDTSCAILCGFENG
jgi:hypothetical protein